MIELLLQARHATAVGMLDQAERLYWQAIEADPRNAMAVVGLAEVALERHDEPTAHRFALKALELDPENLAGQRLASRTAEILLARGDPVPAAGPTLPARPAPTSPAPTPAAPTPAASASPPAASPSSGLSSPATSAASSAPSSSAPSSSAPSSSPASSSTPSAASRSSPPTSGPAGNPARSAPGRRRPGLLRRILGGR